MASKRRKGASWWMLLLGAVLLSGPLVGPLLNWIGVLDEGQVVLLITGLEALFILAVAHFVVRVIFTYRHTAGSTTGGAYATMVTALQELLPGRIAAFVAMEPFLYWDLVRWASRLGSQPGNGAAFGYASSPKWGALLAIVLLLLPVELVLWELLIPASWTWVRLGALVLGLWATLYALGLYASMRLRPHLLRDGALELRYGHFFSARLPLTVVAASESVRGVQSPRQGLGLIHGLDGAGYLPGNEEPRVAIVLREPRMVGNVGEEPRPIKKLYLYVDKPRELLQALEMAQMSGDVRSERSPRA